MIEYVAYINIYKLQHLILGGFNLNIYSQNIYEVIENNIKKHVLIIYNISENHYLVTKNFRYCKRLDFMV